MSASCWKAGCAASPGVFSAEMARRPNYGQQRAEINRGKQAKQEEKERERAEAVARRKAEREGESPPPPGPKPGSQN